MEKEKGTTENFIKASGVMMGTKLKGKVGGNEEKREGGRKTDELG